VALQPGVGTDLTVWNSEPAFGPVVERVVTEAINLDDGSLFELPSSTNNDLSLMLAENVRALELRGVDAYLEGALFALGMTFAPLPDYVWDSPNAVQITYQAILSASATDKPQLVKLPPDTDAARTYAFKTREGGVGLLQITGSTDNPSGVKIRYKLVQVAAASSGNRKPEDSRRIFVRLVVDKAAMTFEGQSTTWDDVGALLEKVPERKNTVLEYAVTSDQITVQQQNEWFGKCIALAHSLGFEYASFIGVHPLGSKGTTASSGGATGATRLPAADSTNSQETPRFTYKFAVTKILPTGATDKRFLNLDSGELLSALLTNEPMVEIRQDVGGGLSVAFHHQHAIPIAREASRQFWESALADDLMDRYRRQGFALLPFERNLAFPIHKVDLPMTFELPGAGILQVQEILDGNPPSVKLRYTRVQTRSPAADSTSSQETPRFTFKPTVELILPTGDSDKRFVNLESGALLSALVTNRPMVEVRRDVGGGLSIAFHNLWAFPLDIPIAEGGARQYWESSSADELKDRFRSQGFFLLPVARNFVFPIQKEQLPMTIELPGEGILQVQEILDGNPSSVKLRYKLVQTSLPPLTAAQTASFGPIVETVLPFGVACLNQLLQFRTGKIFTIGHGPATTKAEYEEDRKRADEAGGVDVWTSRLEGGVQFIGKGSIFTQERSPNWNTTTAETVLEQLKRASWTRGVVEPKTKDFPVTYLFRTARGECGIVQLLDVVEDERGYHGADKKGYGVKLRYKLVQTDVGKTTTER
jgi:hypothetical protein